MDTIISDMAEKLFSELADPQTVNSSTDQSWRDRLWQSIEEMELPKLWVPEALGGAGTTSLDVLSLVRAAGRYALPEPLVETILAHWLAAQAGLTAPTGRATVAPFGAGALPQIDHSGCIHGECSRIGFGPAAEWIAVLARKQDETLEVCLVHTASLEITETQNLAGDPVGRLTFRHSKPFETASLPSSFTMTGLLLAGAALRATQMAGAMETMLNETVTYAQERKAFGREISKFQAIQHNLAICAGHVAASAASALSTASSLDIIAYDPGAAMLPIGAAKIRAGEAAARGSAIAHQVFGAMGFTAECILHRFTHRLLGWRDDFGTEAEWAVQLGATTAKTGAKGFWPMIVDAGRLPVTGGAA